MILESNEPKEFDELADEFLDFCKSLDNPTHSYRYQADLYYRSLGYTVRSIPEVDEDNIKEDFTYLLPHKRFASRQP